MRRLTPHAFGAHVYVPELLARLGPTDAELCAARAALWDGHLDQLEPVVWGTLGGRRQLIAGAATLIAWRETSTCGPFDWRGPHAVRRVLSSRTDLVDEVLDHQLRRTHLNDRERLLAAAETLGVLSESPLFARYHKPDDKRSSDAVKRAWGVTAAERNVRDLHAALSAARRAPHTAFKAPIPGETRLSQGIRVGVLHHDLSPRVAAQDLVAQPPAQAAAACRLIGAKRGVLRRALRATRTPRPPSIPGASPEALKRLA